MILVQICHEPLLGFFCLNQSTSDEAQEAFWTCHSASSVACSFYKLLVLSLLLGQLKILVLIQLIRFRTETGFGAPCQASPWQQGC